MDNINKIDLRALSQMTSPDRAFLSVYLSSKDSLRSLNSRINNLKTLVQGSKDEQEYLAENMKTVNSYLDNHPLKSGGLCLFSCWVSDFFKVVPTDLPLPDLVLLDSSPYIKPLAELQDEYENFLVVVADNTAAKIYMVTAAHHEDEVSIKGNIKNHVRKGGWSQQRYERRRDKELLLYAKEISDKLVEFYEKESFRRILLVGSRETINEILKVVPPQIKEKIVGDKAIDLSKGDPYIEKEIFDLFFEEERRSEQKLWNKIRMEYFRSGLAVIGYEEVLDAAKLGKIDKLIVVRDLKIKGYRCKDCDILMYDEVNCCPKCEGEMFEIDLVEEIVELVKLSSGMVDFVDPIMELQELGGIAGTTRY